MWSSGRPTQPMSNEIVLAAIVVAVVLGIYLLRHVILLAVRLILLAALVVAGYWLWEHRSELIDATQPHLGGVGDRFRELDLSDVQDLLDLVGSSEDASAPETIGLPETTGVREATGVPEEAEETDIPQGPADPEEPGSPEDPNIPE